MNRKYTGAPFLALIFTLSSIGSAAAGETWPEIPSPPKSRLEWVGDSMRVNGVPTRVMQFHSRANSGEVVEYFRAYWSGGYSTKPSITPMSGATVVSQRHGPFFMTAKVEDADGGGSQGLISIAQIAGSKVQRDPGEVPLMPGAQVYSVVESDDPGKHCRTVVLLTPQPQSSVTRFYQASLTNAGWRQVQATETPRTAGGSPGSFVAFARGGSEMQLSIVEMSRGRGSTLIANLVTKDTGPDAD
ncbi:MAG TPA: hypothetical protein VNW26_10220 [Steroidobacteraceae bacterium]|jgi:hypothetical protein|nr:hypothetical protein [Steroidobacteraceae bacterium]